MNKSFSIAVLGPGAVGGLLASLLWRAGAKVTCITNEDSAKTMAKNGLDVESVMFGAFNARPKALTKLEEQPDLLFVTVKAPMLRDAMKRAEPAIVGNAIVVPLLNGIEHMEILRANYGRRVVAGNISVEAVRREQGQITHKSPFIHLELASDAGITRHELEAVVEFLRSAGIDAVLLDGEAVVLWSKFVRLNAIACTTAASGRLLGFIRSDQQWRKELEGCVREAVEVASAYGFKTDASTVMAQIDKLPSDLGSSLQRDIDAGKEPELDALPGAIVRAGAKKGITCPTIKKMMDSIIGRMKLIKATPK